MHTAKASDRGERFRRRVVRERRGLTTMGVGLFRRGVEKQLSRFADKVMQQAASVPGALEAAKVTNVPSATIERRMERFYMEAGNRLFDVGAEAIKAYGVSIPRRKELTDDAVRRMQEYLERVGAQKVTQISETTRQVIIKILQTVVEEGGAIDGAAQRLAEEIPEVSRRRGQVISRTEIIPASNKAVDLGARQAGIPLDKEWISAQDNRTRRIPRDDFDHVDADGQVVDIDEPFVVTGEELMFPGDTSRGASAGNVIQCRCAHAPIPKDR